MANKDKLDPVLAGVSGEYFVAAELSKRGYIASITLRNTKGIDVAATIGALQEKHNTVFGNGYGKLKQDTFRIAHMGDININDLTELIGWIEEEMKA